MIFDDVNDSSPVSQPPRRRRRRRTARERDPAYAAPSRSCSNFEKASRLSRSKVERGDRSTAAWLWMLGLLIAATAGFALLLQQQKSGRTTLAGEAPSERLEAFVDPILAPLVTGAEGYFPESLEEATAQFRRSGSAGNLDDGEVYTTAATIAALLLEAAQDRASHLQKLVDLGSPVLGLSDGGAPKNPSITDKERQHLELAVDVSWQRNSGAYRNRVEELWFRLLRLEQGRFRAGSAPQSVMPESPQTTLPND
jgi:hypothetical protein